MRTTILTWAFAVSLAAAGGAVAHPGGTDEQGCHTCESDCEKWGERAGARHCHGSSDGDETSGEESREEAADENEEGEDRERLTLEESQPAVVREVTDGDTLVVSIPQAEGRRVDVRMLGIDCPESSVNPKCRRTGRQGGPGCREQIPAGERATEAARSLVVDSDREVELESGSPEGHFKRGDYGRLLAYIRLSDGRDMGAVLVEEGYCSDFGDTYPHPRHSEYEELEQES